MVSSSFDPLTEVSNKPDSYAKSARGPIGFPIFTNKFNPGGYIAFFLLFYFFPSFGLAGADRGTAHLVVA